jgi:hypothetical protein
MKAFVITLSNIGTLIGWDKNGPIRNEVEFNLEIVNIQTSAVKREMLLKTMYKRVGWRDWHLWADLKNLNASVKFDSTVRFRYNRTPNSLSRQDREIKNNEFEKIKNKYRINSK